MSLAETPVPRRPVLSGIAAGMNTRDRILVLYVLVIAGWVGTYYLGWVQSLRVPLLLFFMPLGMAYMLVCWWLVRYALPLGWPKAFRWLMILVAPLVFPYLLFWLWVPPWRLPLHDSVEHLDYPDHDDPPDDPTHYR